MRLSQLVTNSASAHDEIEITAVVESLQDVVPGALFACVRGASVDGHSLARQAQSQGAAALLVDHQLDVDIPQVEVADVRAGLAPVAATFWGNPARQLQMLGVTGTNGKTTTTHIADEIFSSSGRQSAVLGTLSGHFTTPPAVKLHAVLADMLKAGTKTVSMEVSSAGLHQHRVDTITYAVGVFTNLTQDHLDYHGTMAAYFEAKAMLFEAQRCELAVINVDDPWGAQLAQAVKIPVVPVSLSSAEALMMRSSGSRFVWRGHPVDLPLVGHFNVYNALCAAEAALAMGVSETQVASALGSLSPVPGRFQVIDQGQPFTVVVDFAHTPDGLENVLGVAKSLADTDGGKTICVFGCGGDRDPDKRPQMGAVAARLADTIFITSDNPRSEDPKIIVNQVLAGVGLRQDVAVQVDRRVAIGAALSCALPGDVVVIAGKGHEATQEIAGTKHPFNDSVEAELALARLGYQGGQEAKQ